MMRKKLHKAMFATPRFAVCSAFRRFTCDESGATAIEYALIASGISIVIAATVFTMGAHVQGLYTSVSTALK
jgi:pilus assembly protein Flp/PilA